MSEADPDDEDDFYGDYVVGRCSICTASIYFKDPHPESLLCADCYWTRSVHRDAGPTRPARVVRRNEETAP